MVFQVAKSDHLSNYCQVDLILHLRATYQVLEDEQHHSSRHLNEEDNQHNNEELNGEKMINNGKILIVSQTEWETGLGKEHLSRC